MSIDQIITQISVPEVKSCVARLVDTVKLDSSAAAKLTLVALLSFYRKNLDNNMSIDTDQNVLKSRLIESGVLYFGPMFDPEVTVSRAKRVAMLHDIGMATESLAFLNSTQIELFYTYIKEIGLVAAR